MPSLRQKVTTYFRQLSFIADGPRDGPRSARKNDDEGNFITKYLEGRMDHIFASPPEVYNGQNPTDLPELKIGVYPTGPNTITAACTGPDDGLTGIKRSKLHLSASYADDIDFIDTIQDSDCYEVRKSITPTPSQNRSTNKFGRYGSGPGGRKLSNGANTPTNDQNANKLPQGIRSRKNSRTSISNLSQLKAESSKAVDAVKAPQHDATEENSNKSTTIVVSMVSNSKAGQSNQNHGNEESKDIPIKAQSDLNQSATSTNGTSSLDHDGTAKLLADTTEQLLHEAVSNQAAVVVDCNNGPILADSIAGVTNWKMESECAFGISVSLYENNMLTKEPIGNPIADCYGMVVRGDAAALALADGVNWGDGARLAARSAVHGCLDYLDRAVFGLAQECMATSTQEVFVSLLRSLWEGHGCILEVGGALSTLTIAVVLPLEKSVQEADANAVQQYVVCACNVGDSLGYVYSKKHGVREFTQASHDITSMRDMRDALGALGPADGNKPELSNLTLSMTIIERGDIVFLTSDGISDNFDPVVGKFAEAWTPDVKLMSTATHGYGTAALAAKRQNKSASALYARLHRQDTAAPNSPPVRPPRNKKSPSPQSPPLVAGPAAAPSRPKYMRSHTVIEPSSRRLSAVGTANALRHMSPLPLPKIPKSVAGLPLVTGPQRHALTLHRLEDLLSYGINGTFAPCTSARRLCHLLIDFVRMITSARRKTLEQRELFYKLSNGPDGVKREVELNRMQHRAARKRVIDSSAFIALPGKLDHATVVAYTVGGAATSQVVSDQKLAAIALQSKEFQETNF